MQKLGTAAFATTLENITNGLTIGYLGLLGRGPALRRGVRALLERCASGMIALSYGQRRRTLRVPKGLWKRDLDRRKPALQRPAHAASVCGGPRARLLDLPHPHHRRSRCPCLEPSPREGVRAAPGRQ